MKVILDVSAANPLYRTGASRFSWDLIESIIGRLYQARADVVLACSRENIDFYRGIAKGHRVELVVIPRKSDAIIRYLLCCLIAYVLRSPPVFAFLSKVLFFRSYRALRSCGAHAMFSPNCVFNVYLDCPVRLVCIHDMQHELNPGIFSLATRVARWAPYRATLAHATKVQVSSRAMMREIRGVAGSSLTRNLVYIPEFYNKDKFPRATGARRPAGDDKALFYPAQAWPHKNHLFLIRALGEAQRKLAMRFRLVLCGRDFGKLRAFQQVAEEADLALDHLGVVTDEQLLECYRSCWAAVLPTRYESSSLPAIEAFAVGALVIAADILPLREFSQRVPIVLFADDNIASFVEALRYAVATEASMRSAMAGAFAEFERAHEIQGIAKAYANELLALRPLTEDIARE